MNSQTTIYYGSGSPFAWAVLIAAEEKGLQYEAKLLSFSDKDNKKPEFLSTYPNHIELSTVSRSRVTELNPRGKVPVLVEGESVVYESQAILHFLESAHPQPALIPASPKDR